MPPDRRPGTWLVGGPLAVVMALLVASMIAWLILGLPVAAYDPLKMPRFFWYYRGDPTVVRALAGGAISGSLLFFALAYLILARRPALHGAARFATERELRRQGFRAPAGIVLGRKRGRFLTFGGTEHVLVEAPTRSGKGVGVVIPNLLTWQGSTVVLDVKRENYDATAGFRHAHGQDVFLFNPTDREGRTARYNPLAYIDRRDPDDIIIELQKIATMLFVAPDHGEAFWATGARTGFIGVGAWLAETSEAPLTFGAIYRHMTQGDVRAFFKRQLADRHLTLSSGCRTALADFAGGSDNSFADIKKTITSVLGLWLNPVIDAATAACDFDLRDLRKRPMSIYLGVSPDELDRIAPLYNLIFQQLVDLNVRALPDCSTPVPVLVVLDEFARLGRAATIAAAFSFIAGYGVRLIAVIQSRSQLRAVYGDSVADEIVANCGVEVAFTPKELRVANELSERIGYIGQESVTRSLTIDGLLANRSKSISEQRRALLLPQELMQLSPHRLILLRGGVPPILGDKIAYFSSRFFRARHVAAPAVAPVGRPRQAAAAPDHGPDTIHDLYDGERDAAEAMDDIVTEDLPSVFIDVGTLERDGARIGTIAEGNERG